MKIAVFSDTHLYDAVDGHYLFEQLRANLLGDVAAVLHAGDIIDPDVLRVFGDLPVFAVRGNMDPPVPDIPLKRVLEFAGHRIGLIHGWGLAEGLAERARREFEGTSIECLVFGHSHYPCNQVSEGMLLFNPGSATDPRRAPFPSMGLLYLEDGIRGEIIDVSPYL